MIHNNARVRLCHLATNACIAIRTHLKNIQPHVEAGNVVMGGATLAEPIQEGEAPKLNGSVMFVCADTQQEAMSFIEKDIYYQSKVWDASKVRGAWSC